MITGLVLTQAQLADMIRHVEEHVPREACGLLAGHGGRVRQVIPVTNVEASTKRFRMEPLEQLRAFEQIDSLGLELLGIFHSHPSGPETVSPTDIAEAAYPVVHVVLARLDGNWKARGYWIRDGIAKDADLQVE